MNPTVAPHLQMFVFCLCFQPLTINLKQRGAWKALPALNSLTIDSSRAPFRQPLPWGQKRGVKTPSRTPLVCLLCARDFIFPALLRQDICVKFCFVLFPSELAVDIEQTYVVRIFTLPSERVRLKFLSSSDLRVYKKHFKSAERKMSPDVNRLPPAPPYHLHLPVHSCIHNIISSTPRQ